MQLSQFIAWRYLRANSRRSFVAFINLFSIAGISLGMAALIIVLSVMNGLENQLKTRILGILPHIVVDSEFDHSASIEAKEIMAQSPYIESEVIAQSSAELKGLLLQGIYPEIENELSIISQRMVAGDFTSIKSGEFRVLISSVLASQMRLQIGDKMRIISPQTSVYSPLGRVPSQRLFTVSGIFNLVSEMDDKVIISNALDVARLTRVNPVSGLDTRLFLYDAFKLETVETVLARQGIGFTTWQARQGALFEAVKMEKNMMALMLGLVILVAGFNVISALVMVVSEKTSDIAILQTQGMQPRQITYIFFFNGIYNSLIGVIIGAALGFIGIVGLNPLLALLGSSLAFGENGRGLPISPDIVQILLIMVVTVSLCALASIYPARQASKILPAHGLTNE